MTRSTAPALPTEPTIGVIANPVSARDIRRVVATAANLQITDRVNIVLRVLSSAAPYESLTLHQSTRCVLGDMPATVVALSGEIVG